MKRILLILVLGLSVSGCVGFNTLRKSVGLYGADAADQALDTSLYGVCKGTTVGAINRRFKTPEEKDAWLAFCATL